MKKLMIMACAAAVAAVGWSSTVIDAENQTITITIDSGTTTIAEALAAATLGGESVTLNYASLNGGDYAAYKIVKLGAGILKFPSTDAEDGGVALPNWTGDLDINVGAVMTTMPTNGANTHVSLLGSTSSGKITVASGAALFIDGKLNTKASGSGINRPIHIIGTGTTAYPGALTISSPKGGGGNSIRNISPGYVYLDGDATICHYGPDQVVSEYKYRYLCGHTLTISNKLTSVTSFVDVNYYYPGATKSEYNANAKAIYSGFQVASRAKATGLYQNYSEGNEIILRNGSYFNYGINYGTYGERWKLVYESTASSTFQSSVWGFEGDGPKTNKYSTMYGPVQLDRSLSFAYGSWSTKDDTRKGVDGADQWAVQDHNIGFLGPISGVGGMSFLYPISGRYYKNSILNLGGANTFSGPLAMRGATLGMFNPEAIPAESSKVTLESTTVYLPNEIDTKTTTYKLRSAEFSGTSTITNVLFGGLTKVSGTPTVKSGTLTTMVPFTTDSRVTVASDATLKAISLSQAAKRKQSAGCLYGYQHGNGECFPDEDLNSDGKKNDGAAYINFSAYGYEVYANKKINTIPYDFDVSILGVNNTYKKDSTTGEEGYRTYSGYLWNDEATYVTWSVMCTLNIYYRLTINGKSVEDTPTNPVHDTRLYSFTLKPGANYFTFVCGIRFTGVGIGNGKLSGPNNTNKVVNLPNNCTVGLFYDKQGRGTYDYNNYQSFSTTGDLPMMTATDCADEPITLGTLAGAGNLAIEDGESARASGLEGAVNVTSGTLELTATGQVASASFGAGKHKLAFDAAYQEYVAARKNSAGLTYGYMVGKRHPNNASKDCPAGADTATYVGGAITKNYETVTNNPSMSLRLPYDLDYTLLSNTKSELFTTKSNSYRSYEGYIWNDEATDAKWSFLITQNEGMRMTINGVSSTPTEGDSSSGRKCLVWNFTLKPGANRFALVCWNRFMGGDYYGPTRTNDVVNYKPGETCGIFYDKQGRGTKDINNYAKFSADEAMPLFTTKAFDIPAQTVSFDEITCVEGTEIDCNGEEISVGTVNGALPKVTNGRMVVANPLTSDVAGLDLENCTVSLDVTQDATKRRADLTGMWYGLLTAVNDSTYKKTHATALYFANALDDTQADFYMTYPETEVVTEMAPMTHVTTWPTEGEAYSNLWKSTATDSLWATDPNRYKTWKGYVWNSSSTNEIWTVINCNNAYVDLRLHGGQCYKTTITDNRSFGTYSGQNGYSRNTYTAQTGKLGGAAKMTQIAVVPGANELKVRYYSRWNTCSYWPGSTETNINGAVFTKWSEGHGLVFDRKGRGTTDIDNYEDFKDATGQLLTREMTDAFPYIRGAGATVDLSGKETAAGMLIGDIKATTGSLVVDGVWNLTAAEVEDDVASTRLQFNASSRLVITDATMAKIYDDMSEVSAHGYVLATDVVGNVKPKLVSAVGDKRMSLVLKDGTLTLMPGLGTLIIAK